MPTRVSYTEERIPGNRLSDHITRLDSRVLTSKRHQTKNNLRYRSASIAEVTYQRLAPNPNQDQDQNQSKNQNQNQKTEPEPKEPNHNQSQNKNQN